MCSELEQIALQPLLTEQGKLLVAFSGGLDSTVLLHWLINHLRHDVSIRAMHIHHGISPFADQWQTHCQRICDNWQIPLQLEQVQLPEQGKGLEARARQVRYAAFAGALQPGEALVCAHHQDDQCETVLLALKRGSGPAGLAAMPESLPFAGTVLLRPLLHCSRQQLLHYARYHQLSWVEDDSNQDDRYDRNFLRLRVLPALYQRWPYFSRTLARSAQLCGEQEQLLDELLAEQLAQLLQENGALRITPMLTMSDVRRGALLRRWFVSQGAPPPSRAALVRVWQEVAVSSQDAQARLQFADHEIRRFQQALWWVPCPPVLPDKLILCWPPPFAPLQLPQQLGYLHLDERGSAVRPPLPGELVSVRFCAGGLWQIAGRARRRNLKKLWQEMAVPPWLRGNIPLLFYGEQLIAAPGFFVTVQGLSGAEQQQPSPWHIHWQRGRH